jgi:formylmethanofuran dehydrogenase subunit E
MYTDVPLADFYKWDAEQTAKLEQLPECAECDEPIQDCYYEINGERVCPECLDSNHKHWIEDYTE